METTPPAPDEEAQKLAAAAQVETDAEEAARAAQEAAKAAQEETHGKPEEQDEQDPKFLLKWFDETYGHKLQGKYKDDEAFLAAYDHLIRMSGKRDEDATSLEKERRCFGTRRAPAACGKAAHDP